MLELRKMNYKDMVEQWKYVTALPADENGLTNRYEGVSFDDYRNLVLPELMMHETPIDMPEWFVPETYYYLWDDDILIGEFRIRHYLTDACRTELEEKIRFLSRFSPCINMCFYKAEA